MTYLRFLALVSTPILGCVAPAETIGETAGREVSDDSGEDSDTPAALCVGSECTTVFWTIGLERRAQAVELELGETPLLLFAAPGSVPAIQGMSAAGVATPAAEIEANVQGDFAVFAVSGSGHAALVYDGLSSGPITYRLDDDLRGVVWEAQDQPRDGFHASSWARVDSAQVDVDGGVDPSLS